MTIITTQHIYPALTALFAARRAEEDGHLDEVSTQLQKAAKHVAKAALVLDSQRNTQPEHAVPVDPASLIDCEGCQ